MAFPSDQRHYSSFPLTSSTPFFFQEVRKLMGALRGAGVTSAGGLTQCMSQVKSMLSGHVTIDSLNYCGVDVNEYVSPSRVEHVLTMLRPDAYGHVSTRYWFLPFLVSIGRSR